MLKLGVGVVTIINYCSKLSAYLKIIPSPPSHPHRSVKIDLILSLYCTSSFILSPHWNLELGQKLGNNKKEGNISFFIFHSVHFLTFLSGDVSFFFEISFWHPLQDKKTLKKCVKPDISLRLWITSCQPKRHLNAKLHGKQQSAGFILANSTWTIDALCCVERYTFLTDFYQMLIEMIHLFISDIKTIKY